MIRILFLSLLLPSVALAKAGAKEADPCSSSCEFRKDDCASECEAARECRMDRGGNFSADFCRRGHATCARCQSRADEDAQNAAQACGKCRARKDVISPLKPWDEVLATPPVAVDCDGACHSGPGKDCDACQSKKKPAPPPEPKPAPKKPDTRPPGPCEGCKNEPVDPSPINVST